MIQATFIKVSFFGSLLTFLFVLPSCLGDRAKSPEMADEVESAGSIVGEPAATPDIQTPASQRLSNCITRPDPADCCQASHQDCGFCRIQMQAALEKWRQECLPTFEELKTCGPGVKITTCCGGDRDECVDCRMKALNAMIGWRQKCSVPEGKGCDKVDVEDQCCTEGEVLCEICRAREAKLRLDRQRRCGVKDL